MIGGASADASPVQTHNISELARSAGAHFAWRVGEAEGIKVQLSEAEWDEAVERTQGYSGSDLSHVITDACYQPLEEGMKLLATPEQQAGITDEHVRPVVWRDLEVSGQLNVTTQTCHPAHICPLLCHLHVLV